MPCDQGATGVVPQAVSATLLNAAEFPSEYLAKTNWFVNQDDNLIDMGYDSKGDLLYYLDELLDYKYDGSPIEEEQENNNLPPRRICFYQPRKLLAL